MQNLQTTLFELRTDEERKFWFVVFSVIVVRSAKTAVHFQLAAVRAYILHEILR